MLTDEKNSSPYAFQRDNCMNLKYSCNMEFRTDEPGYG